MIDEEFWAIIEASRSESERTNSDHAAVLQKALESRTPEDIVDFERIFVTLSHAAYRWDLWAVAVVIGGGCSDDGFADFRSGLIGLGREVYEKAMRTPAVLGDPAFDRIFIPYEELAYAAQRAHEAVTGKPIPESVYPEHPREPAGVRWKEHELAERYPELVARFAGRH